MPKKPNRNKVPVQFMKAPDLKKMMEAVALRKGSFAYRHDLLLHQQTINYKNEYDRIRGMLEHTNLTESSKTRLVDRRNKLHKLINDNLYK